MAWALLALSLLTFTPNVRALRGISSLEHRDVLEQSSEAEAKERSSKLPSLDKYTKLWWNRYNMETRLKDPLPASIRLVMGVFTVPLLSDYRNVIRETWFRQTGVCYWRKTPRKGCSVYVAFVMGANGTGHFGPRGPNGTGILSLSEEATDLAHREPGALTLDIAENMNFGKTPSWFATALKMFPWATHFGKMDMDTYPFLHKLVLRMAQNRSCVKASSDFEFIGRPSSWCLPGWPAASCTFRNACQTPCMGRFVSGFMEGEKLFSKSWHFLQGELYVLSKGLAAAVGWEAAVGGQEDIVTSGLVDAAMEKNKSCVAVRRLDAFVHKELSVDAEFANAV